MAPRRRQSCPQARRRRRDARRHVLYRAAQVRSGVHGVGGNGERDFGGAHCHSRLQGRSMCFVDANTCDEPYQSSLMVTLFFHYFTVVVNIVLLNVLIAISSDAYERVARETATKPASWSQKAATLVMTSARAAAFILLGYSVVPYLQQCHSVVGSVSAVTRAHALKPARCCNDWCIGV